VVRAVFLCVYAYTIHWWAARGGKRIDRRLGLTIPYGVALLLVEYSLRARVW